MVVVFDFLLFNIVLSVLLKGTYKIAAVLLHFNTTMHSSGSAVN